MEYDIMINGVYGKNIFNTKKKIEIRGVKLWRKVIDESKM